MRIAVLADVHGNVRALPDCGRYRRFADIDQDSVDTIVVAGDRAGGPFGRGGLELVRARRERMHRIRGNVERSAVAAFDDTTLSGDPPGRGAIWAATALNRELRDKVASGPIALAVDGVLFCHGSPRSEDEIITAATPKAALSDLPSGVEDRPVVGGHTHQQFARRLPSGQMRANARQRRPARNTESPMFTVASDNDSVRNRWSPDACEPPPSRLAVERSRPGVQRRVEVLTGRPRRPLVARRRAGPPAA